MLSTPLKVERVTAYGGKALRRNSVVVVTLLFLLLAITGHLLMIWGAYNAIKPQLEKGLK